MKLKEYNGANTVADRVEYMGPFVAIAWRNGLFSFSRQATRQFNLLEARVTIEQDEERPTDWYLRTVTPNTGGGLTVRGYKNRPKEDHLPARALMQSTVLARKLLKSLGITSGTAKFMITNTPIEPGLYAILTSEPYKNPKRGHHSTWIKQADLEPA
ncbi:MAG: hypothetical protein QM762_12875 [Chryseolinea sp.]